MNESEKEDKPRISTVVVIWGDIETEEKKKKQKEKKQKRIKKRKRLWRGGN